MEFSMGLWPTVDCRFRAALAEDGPAGREEPWTVTHEIAGQIAGQSSCRLLSNTPTLDGNQALREPGSNPFFCSSV